MTLVQDFLDFCKRAGGVPQKLKDGTVSCEIDRGKNYAYFELYPLAGIFSAALYNSEKNKLQLYSIKSKNLTINPIDFSVCDENRSCILYEPAFFELGYGVNTKYGAIPVKSNEYVDYYGISHVLSDCEMRYLEDGTPIEVKCDVYKTTDIIDNFAMERENVPSFSEITLGIPREVGEKILRKIEKREVNVDFIKDLNLVEAYNPGFLKTMRIINTLYQDEKFRKYFEDLYSNNVNMFLGTDADIIRLRGTPDQIVGFFSSRDKLVSVATAVSEPRTDDELKHTIAHEIGHALVYVRVRTKGKEILMPRWKGPVPMGEEKYVEKFALKVKRQIPRVKEKLEVLKYL